MAETDYARLRALYLEARELSPSRRDALLREHCADDPNLRRAVLELIAAETPPDQEPTEPAEGSSGAPSRRLDGPSPALDPPDRVGPYLIEEVLGRGGMGVVYRALDPRLDRRVALKFLKSDLGESERLRDRFQREARAASALDHPNLCTVYDIGEHEGSIYIAMAYYEGRTLSDIEGGALDLADVLTVARGLASGLAAAHGRGIVHRDLKPANVVLTRDGTPKILDFGIAKLGDADRLTRTGATLGTPGYMAPEQMRGESAGPAADVWAFGAILYEMLVGHRPFRGESPTALLYSVLEEEPEPLSEIRPEVPAWLCDLVHRCLAKEPAHRPADGAALLESLELETFETAPDPERASTSARRRRRGDRGRRSGSPRARTLAVLGVLLLAVAIVALLLRARDAQTGGPERSATELGSVHPPGLVVVPFAVEGEREELGPVADAMAERLTHRLARSGSVRPFAISSVLELRRQGLSDRAIAQRLGAQLLVAGRLDPRGDTLSVGVELLRVGSGEQLWGQRFDEDRKDLIAVEQRVAGEAAAAVAATLDAPGPVATDGVGTADRAAYRAYLQGLHLTQQARFEEALLHLRSATELDPGFAAGWAARADSEAYLGFFGSSDRETTFAAARDHARRALSLDPDLAAGWNALGRVLALSGGDMEGAADAVRRALDLEPDNATAHYLLGMVRLNHDRPREAVAQFEQVLELDPMSRATRMQILRALSRLGRFEEAMVVGERSRLLHPDFEPIDLQLAMAAWFAGEPNSAIDVAPAPWNDLFRSLRDGDERTAEAVAQRIVADRSETEGVSQTGSVVALCLVGRFDEALGALERFPPDGAGRIALMQVLPAPAIDPIRRSARFRDLLEKRDLPRSFGSPRAAVGADDSERANTS